MNILVYGGRRGFTIHIPRPDKMIMVFEIPNNIFHGLKTQMEDEPQESRMYSFPCGNFEELAYKPRPHGIQPIYEVQNFVTFTSEGVVLSIVDHLAGEEARSMAIPYELFDRLENPVEEMDLKW